jgi:hypothetical protein
MDCVELQKSLAEVEDGSRTDQQAHLKTCTECSALVAELKLIASSAIILRAADGPSPRVWNSIEIALRREGLIHPPRPNRSLLPSLSSRWHWLVPAAAALLLAVTFYLRQHSLTQQLVEDTVKPAPTGVSDIEIAGLNDNDLSTEISEQTPELKQMYADNLRRVNESIQDAKDIVADNPNDEEGRRSLLEAYQQKAMLFELAMDRSLP